MLFKGRFAKWNDKVEGLAGLEARGIVRVSAEERHGGGVKRYIQMFALWFSINTSALSIIPGLLGPLVFELGWVDCVCIVIFANALSSCGASYTSTFGPESGNRTMVRGSTGPLLLSLARLDLVMTFGLGSTEAHPSASRNLLMYGC